MCLLNLLWQSFHNIYIYLIITLYTFNLYNVICGLYLNKAKKNKGSTEEGVGAEGSFMEGELKLEFFF